MDLLNNSFFFSFVFLNIPSEHSSQRILQPAKQKKRHCIPLNDITRVNNKLFKLQIRETWGQVSLHGQNSTRLLFKKLYSPLINIPIT